MAEKKTPGLKEWLEEHGPADGAAAGLPCWGITYTTGKGYRTYKGTVTKIGREYVTTDIFRDSRFRIESIEAGYLVEADSNGLVQKLFLFEEDMDAYIEREELASRFGDSVNRYKSGASARQLRAAMAVLDHASDQTCKKIIALIGREEGIPGL